MPDGTQAEPEKNPYERVETDPPPPWFAEIYPGGEGSGWYQKRGAFSMVHHARSRDVLVVAFDNIGPANDRSYGREPWGWKFVRDKGHSYLGIMSRSKIWFRDPAFIAWMEELAHAGFFRGYGRVVFCGTSQGAFASLAFAPLAPGCISVAFNPQSTLDPQVVPWETRWPGGRKSDWSLPYSDAAEGVAAAERAYVVYDPFFDGDRRHAERIVGGNVDHLKLPFAGHFTPVFLRKVGLLKPVMEGALAGTLRPEDWHRMSRRRRTLPWYMKGLTARAEEKGHHALAKGIRPAFMAIRRAEKARADREAAAS